MITYKIEGLDKLADNLRKDAEKQIADDARKAGVTAKFSRNGKIEFSGPENFVRKYLKSNPSLRATEGHTINTESSVDVIPVLSRPKPK